MIYDRLPSSVRISGLMILLLMWSVFSIIASCGYARAADTAGWWNVWWAAGTIPLSYDSYYKAQWAAFSSTGQAYMLYRDSMRGSGATVVTLSGGTTWAAVGSPGFSSGAILDGRLAIGPSWELYAAYRDEANGHALAVKRFNGTAWVDMGSSYFSGITPNFWLNLTISPDGTPYIALQDTSTWYLGVYKYSGGSWQTVGATVSHALGNFVATTGNEPTLQFGPDGTPYVAHFGNGGTQLEVLKFNGVSWSQVGGALILATEWLDYPSMTVADDGSVYVVYMDKSGGSTAFGKVIRYNGSSWSQVWWNIGTGPGVSAPAFAKGLDGTIYFRLYNYANNRGEVYSINGSSLTLLDASIPNETGGGGPGQLLVNPATWSLYVIGEWTGNGLRMTGLFSYSGLPSSGSDLGTGINGSGTGALSARSLAFDSTGTGYTAFVDYSAGANTTVMRRGANGTWTTMGSAGAIPTATGSSYFSFYLAVGPSDIPYVLFRDGSAGAANWKVSVAKWSGSSWVYVGAAGLSSGQANPTQLTFSADGKPYATYRDLTTGYVSARYFDGSAWQNLGTTEAIVSYTSTTGYSSFAPNGDFYVALHDASPATGRGPTVLKWNGTSWSQVGSARIGTYSSNSIAAGPQGMYVGSDGTPRILATDISSASAIPMLYLWKFDGSNWVREGSAIGRFNPAARLEASASGKLYVIYLESVDRGTTTAFTYPTTIKRFVGSDWVTIGTQYFNVTGGFGWMAVNPLNEVPYLPIIDKNNRISVVSPLQVLNSSTSVAAVIGAGAVSVASPASISFPSATTSSTVQTLDFSGGTFTVEDLKWATNGYYVTISVGNLSNGSSTISASNVSARVSSPITTLAGRTNAAVSVPSSAGTIGAGYVPINSAATLVQRSSAGGVLGKYSVSLDLRLAVPAYVPAGNYSGTLTVTLVEN